MKDLPLIQTPASIIDLSVMNVEYVRIAQRDDGVAGYNVIRCKPYRGDWHVESLVITCGGNLGRVLALTCAQTAAKSGLIDTIYLDAGV